MVQYDDEVTADDEPGLGGVPADVIEALDLALPLVCEKYDMDEDDILVLPRGTPPPAVSSARRVLFSVLKNCSNAAQTALAVGSTGGVVARSLAKVTDEERAAAVSILKKIEPLMAARRGKERPCITCGRPFMSEGAHNRMCTYCRSSQSEYDASYRVGTG